MKLPTAPVNLTGRLECAESVCNAPAPNGAAAVRLLFRTTLDPLPGSTQVYRACSSVWRLRSTEVYR
jgi:hypothetical protein